MAKVNTGEGDEYSDVDEAALEAAIEDAWSDYYGTSGGGRGGSNGGGGGSEPSHMRITAQVEWAGSIQRSNGGMRTVNFTDRPLDLTNVGKAVRGGKRAAGWRAKLRQLDRSRGGGARFKESAGLNPSPRTLSRWSAGTQSPSKANRAKIDAAYDSMMNQRSRQRISKELTKALHDQYNVNIRFRDIRSLKFER